jgi:hypothetical protein
MYEVGEVNWPGTDDDFSFSNRLATTISITKEECPAHLVVMNPQQHGSSFFLLFFLLLLISSKHTFFFFLPLWSTRCFGKRWQISFCH